MDFVNPTLTVPKITNSEAKGTQDIQLSYQYIYGWILYRLFRSWNTSGFFFQIKN